MGVQQGEYLFVTISVILFSSFLLPTVISQDMYPDRSRTTRYPFTTDMDQEGEYVLRWGYNNTHILFEVQVHTLGYIGFGISDTGNMVPADVVMGYIANNQVFFYDFHTVGHILPKNDTSQDWFIDYGYEDAGWTVLGFHRLLDTCDPEDRAITDHTSRLIYAYGREDPADAQVQNLTRHYRKGQKGVSLLTRPTPPLLLPADALTAEFLNVNFTIPSTESTTFRCRVFDLSDVTQKYHIIKIAPVLSPETEHYVDHMTLYRCHTKNPQELLRAGESFDCFTDAPGHLQFCREHVASFGHGKTDFYLPEDVGIPLGGGSDEPNMYVLATQYENEEFIPGLVDNSGIQITYTAELRQHEAGFLSLGSIISPNWVQFIPPGEPNFLQRAYCSMRCLAWGMEDCSSASSTAMTVAGVQFHSHGMGRTMKLRHLSYVARNNATENPWLAYDKTYDPDQQTFRVIKDRRTISCWDELMLECGYDSTQERRPTVGGWTDYDELCRAYVLYYPRKRIEGCMSWSNYDKLVDVQGHTVAAANVFQTLYNTTWSQSQPMRRNLKLSMEQSYENGQCWSSQRNVSYAIDYFPQPEIRQYIPPTPPTCMFTRP